ncbi:recombinase family protein [Sphingomonas oryzagri]
MARIYGYARPTASIPDPHIHARQLAAAGAETIFLEKNNTQARRALRERRRLLDQITSGDALILPSLDQLGTNFDDVLRCLEMLVDRDVDIKVLDVGFETAGASNRAYRALLKLLAGVRSALHSETIKHNLAVARAKGGQKAGLPAILSDDQWPDIKARIEDTSLKEVAQELNVSRQTLWNYRRRMAKREDTPAP